MTRRLALGLLLAAGIAGACVIAEPPLDLPTAPPARPTIIRATAVPKTTGVFTGWPDRFIIQVQVADPRKTFFATYFVDYNPATGDGYQNYETSPPSPNETVRTLQLPIIQPTSEGCHVVEVVVAEQFVSLDVGGIGGRSAHTPTFPTTDGDSITWLYSSNGDPSGCPVTDAGLIPIDAGSDGGDGGEP